MQATGKIAVITGAGSGIGRASALALYADGFSVVLAGRRRNMLEETAALAQASPPRMLVVPTDVSDPASIAFCEDTDLDYVSCSPFRVPIARLAAAQAALRRSGKRGGGSSTA